MKKIGTYDQLDELGRQRLSRNFYMREFLHTEIGAWFGIKNLPTHPELAIAMGERLCVELLEPLQAAFGKVHIRSGYRSTDINKFGNERKLNCASNEKNFASHIWDHPDADGHYGATACVVVPVLDDYIDSGGSWTAMAWWIHDHLPYSTLCFFAKQGAFNINWHERPAQVITSYAMPKGSLTSPSMANHAGNHAAHYAEFLRFVAQRELVSIGGIVAPTPERELVVAAPSDTRDTCGRIFYRAVHTKTAWRKVSSHTSLNTAIYGKNGAAALFAGTVRIDYERHGDPWFVIVWEDGAQHGELVRASAGSAFGIEVVKIPASTIDGLEREGYADPDRLAAFF